MNKYLIPSFIAIFILAVIPSPSTAQLYWCEKGDRKSVTSRKIPGANCVLQEGSQVTAPSTNSKSSNTSADRKAEANYPVIGSREQQNRDSVRADLLREELETEIAQLVFFRDKIKADEKSPLDKELRTYYLRRFQAHVQNIKSIQQEIRRL